MSKPIKAMVTTALEARYEGVENACVVDLAGMTVGEQQGLRAALREKSAEVHVVKNSLARRAFSGMSLEPLGKSLAGPCALVTSQESIIDAAKILVEAAKEYSELTLKDAMMEGDANLLTVVDLAKMKGRLELIGEVAMLLSSPGRAVAGCVQSPAGKIAGCLKAITEKAA